MCCALMLGQPSQTGIGLGFIVMPVATFILISIGTRLYPSAAM